MEEKVLGYEGKKFYIVLYCLLAIRTSVDTFVEGTVVFRHLRISLSCLMADS